MAYRKLGRDSAHRKAMLREMTTQLIMNERIVTTETRAKEIRKTTEKMITLGKRGDLSARRKAAAFVRNEIADIHEEKDAVVVNQHFKNFSVTLHLVTKIVMVVTPECTS